MELSNGIINVIEKRFTGDFKQNLYMKLLELEGDLPMFITADDMNKWLSKVANNEFRNTRWQENNQARIMEDNADEIRQTFGYDDVADDPMDILIAEEMQDTMEASLSDRERDIYERCLEDGMSYKQCAEQLGITEVTVRWHVHNIKEKYSYEQTNGQS